MTSVLLYLLFTSNRVSASQAADGKLAASGKFKFFADKTPEGNTQVPISTKKGDTELTITWKAV